MTYITKDIITAEGVEKKQFYKLVGMKNIDDNIVEVQVRDGEYDKTELEWHKTRLSEQAASITTAITEVDDKLTFFPVEEAPVETPEVVIDLDPVAPWTGDLI